MISVSPNVGDFCEVVTVGSDVLCKNKDSGVLIYAPAVYTLCWRADKKLVLGIRILRARPVPTSTVADAPGLPEDGPDLLRRRQVR